MSKSKSKSRMIIIVEKQASLKNITVKDFKVEELYKKAGFKKADGFNLQTEWPVKIAEQSLVIQLYGKLDGKSNMENKYEFPPPVDSKLFFGSCVLVAMLIDNSNGMTDINLPIELWNKIYEKLFGGFDDIVGKNDVYEDDDEDDELETIPNNMKTKAGGYLKDGFVVDGDGDGSEPEASSSETDNDDDKCSVNVTEDDIYEEYIGSELSEEAYDYSDTEYK